MSFRKLILDYEQSCPSRGRGKARAKYPWAALVEEWRASTSEQQQKKRKMMDFVDFVVHFTTKRMKSNEEAQALWYSYMADPSVRKDKKGLSGDGEADWRVEVVKGDYRNNNEELTYSKVASAELQKVRKPSEMQIDEMMNLATTDHPGLDHHYFQEFREGRDGSGGPSGSNSSFQAAYEEPLAVLDSKGKPVVKLAVEPNEASAGRVPKKDEGDSVKSSTQLAAAKTSAMSALSRLWTEEHQVGQNLPMSHDQ